MASDQRSPTAPRGTVRLPRQTMAGQVADELRRQILAGELAEGAQLLQEQLAAEFGISKVPVREALYQLEAEGFVSQQFHRGAVVSGLSPEEIMEVFELRTQIEVWLLDLGMAAATAEDVERAGEFGRRFEETADPDQAWDLNWRFHEALYVPAGKPFVLDHVRKLHSQVARYVRNQYALALRKEKVIREHAEILRLFARKDRKVMGLLQRHILTSAKVLTDHLKSVNETARLSGAGSTGSRQATRQAQAIG